MSEKMENFFERDGICKENHMDILERKTLVSDINNSLDRFHRGWTQEKTELVNLKKE